jgi:hypothetical protein
MGLEPTTAGATIQSSTYLSYGHHRTRTVSIANAFSVVNSPFSLLPLVCLLAQNLSPLSEVAKPHDHMVKSV